MTVSGEALRAPRAIPFANASTGLHFTTYSRQSSGIPPFPVEHPGALGLTQTVVHCSAAAARARGEGLIGEHIKRGWELHA